MLETIALQRRAEFVFLDGQEGLREFDALALQPLGRPADEPVLVIAGECILDAARRPDEGSRADHWQTHKSALHTLRAAEDEHAFGVQLAALEQEQGVADALVAFIRWEVAEEEAERGPEFLGAGRLRRRKHGMPSEAN